MSQPKPLFFNLDTIEQLDVIDTIPALRIVYYNTIPKSKYSRLKKFSRNKLLGASFLLNPEPILNDNVTDPNYLVQYVRLAGRRSYAMHKLYNLRYLDLSYFPDISLEKIKHNPLLTIAKDKIHFKYEDY